MTCPKCHTQIMANANFCHVCSFMLRPYCVLCRLPLPANAHFCAQCGHALGSSVPYPAMQFNQQPDQNFRGHQQPAQAESFAKNPQPPLSNLSGDQLKQTNQKLEGYMPEHLKDKYQQASAAIESERKLVSIVFADISGFTAMSEKMDPETVTDIMNKCFQELGKIVYEHEGYIDKFMGDCIMALFGAPIAHENDPELAVLCALKMLERLESLNKETGLDLGMSIGINSGMVIAGGVGSNEKFEYTVMGDAVNLAQRLESAADRGQVLVSKNIYRPCEKKFEFKKLEPIKVKGKQDKIKVFAAIDRRKQKFKTKSLHAGYGKLIGREYEIELFKKCIKDTIEGRGQIFCIQGEAGIGKSRFKHEIKKLILKDKISWYEAGCSSLQKEKPYAVFILALSEILGIDITADLEVQQSQIASIDTDNLSNLSSQTKRVSGGCKYKLDEISKTLIYDLLSIPLKGKSTLQLDPAKKKRSLFIAIKSIFIQTAKNSPTLIYLEDLHWIDPLSLELLTYIMDSVPSHSLLLAGSFRKEFKHDWYKKPYFHQLTLEPLSLKKSVLMVKNILGFDEVPKVLEDIIINKTDGNPLYIEEIIKSMIDADKIYKSNNKWHIAKDIQDVQIPPTVQGLIASRIDKLEDTHKQLIQHASVIGRQFSDALLAKSAGFNKEVYESLKVLRNKELIFEISSDLDEITYIFNHALTQEVAYQSILNKKRKEFHECVGKAIEDLYYKKIDDYLEALAHHYVEAGVEAKSISYLLKSAEKLFLNFSNKDAIKSYETAIELMENSAKPQLFEENLWKTYARVASIHSLIGEYDLAEKYQNKILKIGEQRKDHLMLTQCYRHLGDIARIKGHPDESVTILNLSLNHAHQANDFASEIETYKALGNTMKLKHDIPKAIDYLSKGLKGARDLGLKRLEAEYLNDIALTHIAQNQLEAAWKNLTESIKISKENPALKSILVSSTLNLGVIQYFKKDFEGALTKFKETFKMSQQIGDLGNTLLSSHNIGEILLEFKNYDEAILEFEKSYEIAKDIGNDTETLNNKILIGYVKSKQGKENEAKDILEEAIKESTQKKLWAYYCDACFYLGKHFMDYKHQKSAKKAFDKALKKAIELNNKDIINRAECEIKKMESVQTQPIVS